MATRRKVAWREINAQTADGEAEKAVSLPNGAEQAGVTVLQGSTNFAEDESNRENLAASSGHPARRVIRAAVSGFETVATTGEGASEVAHVTDEISIAFLPVRLSAATTAPCRSVAVEAGQSEKNERNQHNAASP